MPRLVSILARGIRRFRPAAAVRAVAGSAGSRRGSVLVLVIGTLAMMSVLAVVFVTVSKGDRRAAAAVVKRAQRAEVPDQVRDYVANVIARDVFSAFPSPESFGNDRAAFLLRRESWDSPSSDPRVMSMPSRGINRAPNVNAVANRAQWSLWRFRPEGDHPGLTPGDLDGSAPSLRRWSDPWLASDHPDNLTFVDDFPTGGDGTGGVGIGVLALGDWYNRRDYFQISNFAPDGRAVNLFNLRKNFDARSDYQNLGDISFGLTLYGENHAPQNYGANQERLRLSPTDDRFAHPNRPSDWFSMQRGMAVAVSGGNLSWADPRYKLYQYADADGDGILDSRWVELVDATDPNNPTTLILDPSGEYRYFFAFKAIDLSGRVNVNVATDQIAPPTNLSRLGATPADIDLRRLLMVEDSRQERLVAGRPAENYSFFEPPVLPGTTNIDQNSPQWYGNYTSTNLTRQRVGDSAYNALRIYLATGVVPPRHASGADLGDYVQENFPDAIPPANRFFHTTLYPSQWELSALGRAAHFYTLGAPGDAITGRSDGSGGWQYRISGGFGIADLAELLTYNGVNDPDVLSPLEAVISGRYAGAPNLDPLRSNRSLALERGDRDNIDRIGIPPRFAPDSDNDWNDTDADAYLHLAIDIRRKLTTLSGARPLHTSVLGASAGGLSNAEVKMSLPTLLADLSGTGGQLLFSAFVKGLAPYAAAENAWTLKGRTLNYGYVSPQASIRVASHMLANWKAAIAPEDEAEITAPRNRAGAVVVGLRQANPTTPWDGLAGVRTMDNTDPRTGTPLWTTTAMTPDVPNAVVAFPIEAHPFITEVAMASLYTDAPNSIAGGDSEDQNISPSGFPQRPTINPNAHYNPNLLATNPDYIFEALAVQLHNPFSYAVAASEVYYIEFVRQSTNDALNRSSFYYRVNLPQDLDSMHKVGGQDTITVLAVSLPLDVIDQKLLNCARGYVVPGDNTGLGRQLLSRLFVPEGDPLLVAQRIDRDSLNPIALSTGFLYNQFPTSVNFANLADYPLISEVRLWRRPDASSTTAQADILVDRLRVPLADNNTAGTAPLNRVMRPAVTQKYLASDGYEIRGRFSGLEKTDYADNNNPNQGLTILLYGSVRRPTDETFASAGGTLPRAFPLWCVEGRRKDIINNNPALNNTSWNLPFSDNHTDLTVFRSQDILTDSEQNRYFRFEEFVNDVRGGLDGTSALTTIRTDDHPKDKTFGADDALVNTNEAGLPLRLNRIQALGYVDRDLVRPADAFLPMAIGPQWAIDAETASPIYEADRWMTTSQALAIAMGLHRSADVAMGTDIPHELDDRGPVRFYAQNFFWNDENGVPAVAKPLGAAHAPRPAQNQEFTALQALGGLAFRGYLDRGHIVLDDFVPFYAAAAAPPTPLVPPARINRATDTVMGLGLTPAMMVLETFQGFTSNYGSLAFPTPGVLNLNNATRTTLRTLPLLSPTHDLRPEDNQNAWWWPNGRINRANDIASTVATYRDRSVTLDRFVQAQDMVRPPIDFSGANRPTAALYGARANATYIPGLRDDRGLVSVAELFAARRRNPDLLADDAMRNRHNIDRLGTPDRPAGYIPSSIGFPGIDSVRYAGGTADDGIGDDYAQQLAIVNALMNTTSVRSDYFAVWFVMHGYRRSDVENLESNDPLIPSIARRFLMVLDRSNVISPGDSPRIVLFKEVPM
ncbi:MAG: hypothetical protein KF866_03495 [Phycisphaeraceae bacterium]|nr:hypothetical protein [Phycisphaeraceae bacterium]